MSLPNSGKCVSERNSGSPPCGVANELLEALKTVSPRDLLAAAPPIQPQALSEVSDRDLRATIMV